MVRRAHHDSSKEPALSLSKGLASGHFKTVWRCFLLKVAGWSLPLFKTDLFLSSHPT